MSISELRDDISRKQKKGIHIILASIVIWIGISIIHSLNIPIESKNLFTFCMSAPLMPISYMISKLLKIEFSSKDNPLGELGFTFTMNQALYLLIVMWVFNAVPEKMLMVFAMVFGAHLFPYYWIYKSKSYLAFSIIIPIVALVLGNITTNINLALCMLGIEIVFTTALYFENKKLFGGESK